MKIEESTFSDFPNNGALRIEITQIELEITDSVFTCCSNRLSGGAIRVSVNKGNVVIKRSCGRECYTTVTDNANDFGQFVCIECSTGNNIYEMLTSCFCPHYKMVSKQNGPLGFIGKAKLLCTKSNSSNNLCYFGSGFSCFESNDINIRYMNFANDTSYISDSSGYWMAVAFHSSTGIVQDSNFFECESFITSPTKPVGTYIGCIFTNCINYGVDTLLTGNREGTPSDFGFPQKCAAHIKNNGSKCITNSIKSITAFYACATIEIV